MTRDEFDIACKLALGYALKEKSLYFLNYTDTLVLYGFTETGVNFFIDKNEFMEYHQFMDLISEINDEIVIDGGMKPLDMIPFIVPNFHHKIVP